MNPQALIAAAKKERRTALDEIAGKQLLASFGVTVPKSVIAKTTADVATAIVGMQAPFALKVMSPEILHKSDAGGVKIGLKNAGELIEAITVMAAAPQIKAAQVDGWLIEEMAPAGQEVVVGAVRDPNFGPLVMVGLGGIFVEILADVAFRICPITRLDAVEMLDELKGVALLDGARGRVRASREAIIDVLLKVGGDNGLLMQPLFKPKTVAVVGASTKGAALPNVFIRRIRELGFTGAIYPIHPSAPEIDGLKAYRSLADTPEPIDYTFIAIAGAQIPPLLEAANGRVRFAQVISSGFGEVDEGRALQQKLVDAARAGGMRLLGPNCLGIYSPRGHLTFTEIGPRPAGGVGVVSQSGGLGTDIVRRGLNRGLKFSALVTVGNCADIGPSDMLEYYFADPDTKVIGMYIETARDARRIFEILRAEKARKPVVLLKGGRTKLGLAAAVSHTGSLAGDDRAWVALSRQTGCILTESLDEFIDTLLIFQTLTPRTAKPTESVVLFGNGGGASVLATDTYARLGLEVAPIAADTITALAELSLPPGTSITNPVDCPVGTLQQDDGRVAEKIVDIIYRIGKPEALVMHLNMAPFVGRSKPEVLDNVVLAALRVQSKFPGAAHFLLVLRSDGDEQIEARKREFRARAVRCLMKSVTPVTPSKHCRRTNASCARVVVKLQFLARRKK